MIEPPAVTAVSEAGDDIESTPTAEATTLPGGPAVAIISAAADATVRCGAETTPLAKGDSLLPGDCRPLRVTGGEGISELALPDGTRLILDSETVVNLLPGEGESIAMQIGQGRLLVLGEARTSVANADGARASLDRAGVMGVLRHPSTLLFEVACLAGQCSVRGENDDDDMALRAGQGSVVRNSGRAGPPENADFGGFLSLAPGRVPTPTVTPTPTPTRTPTATPTRRAAYPTMTPTLDPTQQASSSLAPTATPSPPDEDEPTRTPRPPTATPTEPPPLPTPTATPDDTYPYDP